MQVTRENQRQLAVLGAGDPLRRWAATFPGGKSPLSWNGTDEVLKEYTGGPAYATVKYGQAGVRQRVAEPGCDALVFQADGERVPDRDRFGSARRAHRLILPLQRVTKTYAFDRPQTIDSWWNYHV